jgi:hypothetical protein
MADETPLARARMDILEENWSDALNELAGVSHLVNSLATRLDELQRRLDIQATRCEKREGRNEFFRQGVNDTIDEILRRLKEAGI